MFKFLLGVIAGAAACYWWLKHRAVEADPDGQPRLLVTRLVYDESQIVVGGEISMLQMTVSQRVTATITPRDRKGDVAPVQEGSVEWSSSNPEVAAVTENPTNQLSADIRSLTTPGEALITFKADADLGEGVKEITGVLAVAVTPLGAVTFEITTTEPVDVEEAPAAAATEGA